MRKIDPKNLMALERAVASLLGIAISFIVLGFVVQKFELFLRLIAYEIHLKHKIPPQAIEHYLMYKYLGIAIVIAGIAVALYSYFYYTRWIELLKKGTIDFEMDKKIYLYLALFIALIGVVLIVLMSL